MWKLTDISEDKDKPESLFKRFEHYVMEKNLNFIVARGECINQEVKTLNPRQVTSYLDAYAACDFSMIALFNDSPKTPFIAANMEATGIARVEYLIDFNPEAISGKASPFYSKLLGAFATHFFALHPRMQQLWFPFAIKNIVGSKMTVHALDSGTAILR